MGIDVFDLKAKISLDTKSYEQGLEQSKGMFSKFGEGIKSAAGAVGSVLADVAKGATAAIGAAGTALTALTKQSLDVYANFEQLEGGAKLMFGEAADYIIQKSEEAYKTVQLSQNEYLQQVNGFAVGLKTALGGNAQAAAELADKIVQAEADVVAATGNTQEMVQNAFNGIMRSNYTMLDNLGLGIKPTKEGMEEVIEKVNEWNATHGKASEYAIDNLADVQAALVDYIEMQGMAGYASMEAGSTITGSIAGVKAAWQNFLSGNGNIKDFTDMLIPTAKNIRTKLNTIILRLTEGLTELVDQVSPYIPELIEETLPAIIDGASSLLTGLAGRLPNLITAILPALADGVISVTTALVGVMPELITSLKKSIPIIVQTIMEKKNELLQAGKDMLSALFPSDMSNVPQIMTSAVSTVTAFATDLTSPENVKKITGKAFEIIKALANGLTSEETLKQLFDSDHGVPVIISNIASGLVEFSSNLIDTAFEVIGNLCGYLLDPENEEQISDAAERILMSLGEGFVTLTKVIYHDITDLMADIMAHMVGEFDADATAFEMLTKLGKALAEQALNVITLGGYPIAKFFQSYGVEADEAQEYLDATENGFEGYKKDYEALSQEEKAMYQPNTSKIDDSAILTAIGMRASGHIPANSAEEYLMRYAGRNYGAPNYAAPTALPNTSYGDNNVNITINTTSDRPDEIGYAVSDAVDQSLAKLQAQKNRGYGYIS